MKVFELTAEEIEWEVEPGRRVKAWAYNRQVPGPQIRVREGDRVRVVLTNKLSQSTSIHFHGLELPNGMDGVPFITQPPVKSGESYMLLPRRWLTLSDQARLAAKGHDGQNKIGRLQSNSPLQGINSSLQRRLVGPKPQHA